MPATGCDWGYYALLNSIPIDDTYGAKRVHVLLGVDSLALSLVEQARAQGAFSEDTWRLAPVATAFPGTSDSSWTRTLHTEPIDGYEYQYYDPTHDEVVRAGYWGLFTHAVPWLEKPCYEAFDYAGDGLTGLYYMYQNPWYSLSNALDSTFVLIAGRQASGLDVVTSYLNEVDAMGHMLPEADSLAAVMEIDRRIRAFKRAHPKQTYLFTLISDHGQNFTPCATNNCLVRFQEEMPSLGLTPVTSLREQAAPGTVAAIPIIHTRVSYLALHCRDEDTEEVARRASGASAIDLAVSHIAPIVEATSGVPMVWYGVWKAGVLILRFGHAAATDTYVIDRASDFAALDIAWTDVTTGFANYDDEQLFALTSATAYPDFFYRVRTGLSAVGVRYPAQVLLSFASPNASIGFEVPGGANAIAAQSFHGSLARADTLGVLLTEERDLPALVRGDTALDLVPVFRRHFEQLGTFHGDDDPNEALDYDAIAPLSAP